MPIFLRGVAYFPQASRNGNLWFANSLGKKSAEAPAGLPQNVQTWYFLQTHH